MFSLIVKCYRFYSRWYKKFLLWKLMLIGFGALWLFATKYTSVDSRWEQGDLLTEMPTTCFIAIDEEPWFIPFQSFDGQPLKNVADGNIFNATRGQTRWELYHSDDKLLMNYEHDLFNQSSVYYRIENGRPVVHSCSAGESFWFSALKGFLVALLLVLLSRLLWRKLRQKDPKEMKREAANSAQKKLDKAHKQSKGAKPVSPYQGRLHNQSTESVIETTKSQQNSVIDKKR